MSILQYIRIYADVGFLVQMVGMTISQVVPFMVFFLMWILFFTVCFMTLKVSIDNVDEEYANVFEFIQYFLMTYRNALGDSTTPGYSNWLDGSANDSFEESLEKNTAITFIWAIWLSNSFLNLVILLNFLIALISQVYEKVISMKEQVMYSHRAEMNEEYFMQKENRPFKVLVFSLDKDIQVQEENEWEGFVQ